MLPLKHRLPLRQQPEFFTKARRLYSNFLTVYYQKNELETADSRGVVVVPKAVSKKATARNKIKRQLRAQLFKFLTEMKNTDLVVVAKKDIMNKEMNVVSQDLTQLLNKIK